MSYQRWYQVSYQRWVHDFTEDKVRFTVKGRAATKAKPALVNAVHAFYLGEDVDIEHPDHYITQHSSTGARYDDTPHYMHSTRLWTCAIRVERGSRTVVFR